MKNLLHLGILGMWVKIINHFLDNLNLLNEKCTVNISCNLLPNKGLPWLSGHRLQNEN